MLERIERCQRAAPPETGHTVDEIVARVREQLLEAHAPTVLRARCVPPERERLLVLTAQLLVNDGLTVPRLSRETLAEHVVQELVGYGPIDPLVGDDAITEIMVNGPREVYVERNGTLLKTDTIFESEEQLTDLIVRIVAPLGRRIDRASPFVDARLPDGSRVNAVLPPLSLIGPVLTIRKFPRRLVRLDELVAKGTLSPEMADYLGRLVRDRVNLIISGGTSSGKTTTLNVLCQAVPSEERIITVEDAAELDLAGRHAVRLETRAPNLEGQGAVDLRQLLRNALRMRPDRLVVGEVRGGETFDLIQAMNTGHTGSMTTVHANSARDALRRLEGMMLMGASMLPVPVVRQHLAAAIGVVVHQARAMGGGRRIVEIARVRLGTDGEFACDVCFRDLSEGRASAGRFEHVSGSRGDEQRLEGAASACHHSP